MRSGTDIDNKVCEKLKGVVDSSKDYTSGELLDSFRDNPNLGAKDLFWWLFGGAEFFGSNPEKELLAHKILNQFIANNPNNTGLEEVYCTSKSCGFKFYHAYLKDKSDEELLVIKSNIINMIEINL